MTKNSIFPFNEEDSPFHTGFYKFNKNRFNNRFNKRIIIRNHQSLKTKVKILVMGSFLSEESKKTPQMKKTKQNLILFFEETNDVIDINSKLVRLYMNRSVIDEEDQNEISEIHVLSKSVISYSDFHNEYLPDSASPYLIRVERNPGFEPNIRYRQRIKEARDLFDFQQQRDKLKNDRIIFEQSVSKIIESEMTRLREQDWFREWLNEVHENGGLENWSDKKSGLNYLEWLRIKLTQSENEYTNHFIVGTSFYTNSYTPVRYLTKAFLQNCFHKVTSVKKYKRKHEEIEISYVSDLIENSTMVTVLRGTSANFLTAEQYNSTHAGLEYTNKSITDELEDLNQYNMTANELFAKDEFKALDCYKLLTDLDFRKLKLYYDKEKIAYKFPFFENNDSGYEYIRCQRFSFPIARISLRHQTEFFNKISYFQKTSPMIRQCVNQLVIAEEDQFDIDGVYRLSSQQLSDISPPENFSALDTDLEEVRNLVDYIGSGGIFDMDLKGPRSLVEFYATDRFTPFSSWNHELTHE